MFNGVVIDGGDGGHSYSISLIRLISLIMIITCHMMQYKDFVLAWWFNVGVQIFLCISGFLYGQKKTEDVPSFYSRRFLKILIPYYIVFLVVGITEACFVSDRFNLLRFVAGLVCRTTIAGGEHLWFVAIILFCYVLTPVLNNYRDKYIYDSNRLCIGTIVSIIVVSIFGGLFSQYYNPAWLSCYVIGYALGVNEDKTLIKRRTLILLFGIVALVGNGIQIYGDYALNISLGGYIGTLYQYFKNYNHVCLGVFLFLLMNNLFDQFTFSEKSRRVLDISDKYSYEVYLVHQFLILGPFSLMALTTVLPLNVVVILIGIVILAWMLKKAEAVIMTRIVQ